MLPCQTTPGTAAPTSLPDRHHLCRSGVMDTGTHFDHCHLRDRGRHLALSYPSQDPRQCVGQLCLVEQASSLTAEKYLYSALLWPGFSQLKYSFGFADSSPFLLPDSTRSVGLVFPDTTHACLAGEARLLPGEHDPSSSVSLTASQTPRRPTVPRRPFFCFSLARLISSTTRGLGAFHQISLENAAQISCTAVSMPHTRNLWELVGPLAVPSSCKSEQAHSTAVQDSRLSAPVIVVLSVMIESSTFVSTRCSNRVAV